MTTEPSPPDPDRAPRQRGWIWLLTGSGLLWLIAAVIPVRLSLGAAYADPREPDPLALAPAAFGVPTVISASLLGGAAVGLALIQLSARRRSTADRRSRRAAVGAAAGLLVGGAVAVPMTVGHSEIPAAVAVLAAVAAGSAGLGGLLAGLFRPPMVAAAVAGTLAVFVVGYLGALLSWRLLDRFGGQTAESILVTNRWTALLAALVAGLLAGAISFGYLRRYAPDGLRWPAYLLVGAAPGLVLLFTEAATRLAGAPLFRLLGMSPFDAAILRALDDARSHRALVVLFVGALVSVFLLGRSLTPLADDDRESDEVQSPSS